MTPFDFVSVFFSVILGLGVSHLLASAAQLVKSRTRVQLDWIPSAWAATAFLLLIQAWWGMWSLHSTPSWSYGSFIVLVLYQSALYLVSTLVLPDSYAESSESLSVHFGRVRPTLYAAMSVISLSALLINLVVFRAPFSAAFAVLPLLGVLVSVGGIAFSGRNYQAFATLFFCLGTIALMLSDAGTLS